MVGSLMKKRESKDIYYKNLTIENIYNSFLIVRRTCKNEKMLYNFELNLNTNLFSIYEV